MKVAYLALVHRNPRLLARAIKALSTKDSAFFIHVDKKSNIEEFSGISCDNVSFSRRVPAFWGEFTLVEATLILLKDALNAPAKYDYFVLMLGSDYPLRSSAYIENFLEENNGCEFINLTRMPTSGFPLSKINQLRYPSSKPVLRFASRVLTKFGLGYRDYRKHLGGMDAYAGDQCWTLSRSACQYILDFVTGNSNFEAYFRNTFTSDEVFFQTILGNSSFHSRIKRGLLYRDWPQASPHPNMMSEAHIDLFEKDEKVWLEDEFGAGEALFARKFSDDNLGLIDRLDAAIERKEYLSASTH